MNMDMLLHWIREREAIRLKRAAGLPQHWTDDRILRACFFTNVRREHDRTTMWVANNWREPNRNDPDLGFAMTVAVFVNKIETLEELGYPVPWNAERFREVMAARAARGEGQYGGAYMIRADGRYSTTSAYQIARVFNPLWEVREWMRPRVRETLAQYAERLSRRHGFGGGFMSGQLIAYLKYAPPLCDASDWDGFVVSGPGSRRGLNRVFGRSPNNCGSPESVWRKEFNQLRAAIQPHLQEIGLGDLHAQDLQSCLCEADKYERVRKGEGRSKRRFRPNPDPLPGGIAEAAE